MSTKAQDFMHELLGQKLSIGAVLSSIRQGEELTQVEFAKRLGVSKQYVCDVEHARKIPSPQQAYRFANELGHSEALFVSLALQDLLDRANIPMKVELKKIG